MKKMYILLGLCLIIGNLLAQEKGTFITDDIYYMGMGRKVYLSKMLEVGNKMPAHTSTEVFNTPENSINLGTYKGKLVILDFWFSGCSTCIAAFPKMQRLQDEFKDKIKIILVSGDTKRNGDNKQKLQQIIDYTSRLRGVKINLPCILNDTTLDAYFACNSMPHEVWIGPSGNIIGITDGGTVTSENIQAVLAGKEVHLPLKFDFVNTHLPLFLNKNVSTSKTLYCYSAFTGYSNLVTTLEKSEMDSTGNIIGCSMINYPLVNFYIRAYPDIFKNTADIVYETRDSLLLKNMKEKANKFCYEAVFPPIKPQEGEIYIQNQLKQNLGQSFNYSLRREKRSRTYISITLNQHIRKSYAKESVEKKKKTILDKKLHENNLSGDLFKDAVANHKPVFGHHITVSDIGALVQEQFGLGAVFDKVGNYDVMDKLKFDLDFPANFDFNDKAKLKGFLSSKGFDLTVEPREIDVVVIGDRKEGEPRQF